jgi:putative ABC transport system ATP-binding protein
MTVLEAIERINRELGTLTVIITHNAVIAGMADRVLTLSDGRIVGVRVNERRAAVRSLAW